MQLKYVGPALLLAAAGLIFTWIQRPHPTADTTQARPASLPASAEHDQVRALALLEQHLASLSERVRALEQREVRGDEPEPDVEDMRSRLEAVEIQLRRQAAFDDYAEPGSEPDSKGGLYALDVPDPYIAEVQQAFDNDDSAGVAEQAALENAETIFDSEELGEFEFSRMDCRAKYCKLTYEDYSSSSAAASIAENELFLLLAEKYGDDIVIHGGEQSGTSKSFYIERTTAN